MKFLALFAGAIICLDASMTCAQDTSFSSRSSSGGLELETWIEMSALTWDSLVVCGRLTNRTGAPHMATFAFQPPFWVSATDDRGTPLKPAPDHSRYFTAPNTIQLSSVDREIAPGETAETRIPFTTAFIVTNPANARITVSWNPQLADEIKLDLTNELRLPEKPMIIAGLPKRLPNLTTDDAAAVPTNTASGGSTPPLGPKANVSSAAPLLPPPTSESPLFVTPWLAWAATVLAALGLLWLMLKKRN